MPLVINGQPVTYKLLCDSDLDPKCAVNQLHPAPRGSKWLLFKSNDVINNPLDDGFLVGRVRINWPDKNSCGRLVGQSTAFWLSDTSDAQIDDLYVEHFFTGPQRALAGDPQAGGCTVGTRPSRTPWIAGLLLLGGVLLRRRRSRR